MAKSLKDILTGTKSSTKTKVDLKDWEKSKDGQKFAAKHTIEKHADRAGNGDDVYKGKTKEAKYDRQKDGVYEEVEKLDEVGDTPKGKAALKSYVNKALDTGSEKSVSNLASRGGYELGKSPADDMSAGVEHDKKAVVRSKGVLNAVKRLTKESNELEEEQIDEISDKLAWSYTNKNLKEPTADPTTDAGFRKNQNRDKGLKLALDKQNYPKTSLNKAKVPTSDATNKEKKYQDAIKEEEQLDELSDKLKADYREKATADIKNKFDSAMDSERMGDSKTTNKLLKKIASRKVNIKKSMNESMKCESCGAMYEGESCGCGGKKKLLLGGKKSLKEVLSRVKEEAAVEPMLEGGKKKVKK